MSEVASATSTATRSPKSGTRIRLVTHDEVVHSRVEIHKYMVDQALLSEQLQLIHSLMPSDRDRGPSSELSHKERLELEILDALSLYLDKNGGEEDIIAVTFDKTSAVIRCILAKQLTPSLDDLNYTKKFFSAISTFKCPLDLLSFALEHTIGNARKKIRKISEIELTVIDKYLDESHFREGQEEFTNKVAIDFANQFGQKWNLSASEPESLLRRAYIEAKTMASKLASPNTGITQAEFIALLRVVYIVVHSHFGSNSVPSPHETTGGWQMCRIRRRFNNLSQYFTGAVRIHYCRRFFPEGAEIPHVWVQGPQPMQLALSISPITTAERHFPTLSEKKLECAIPNIFSTWSPTALLRVHPELLLLHHLEVITPSERCGEKRLIGCSRPTCLCCQRWIDFWNLEKRCEWMTSRWNGMPSCNWRFPGSCMSTLDKGNADKAVALKVDNVLDYLLEESTQQRLVRPLTGPKALPMPEMDPPYDMWE